ncbi:unnamed protein product [Caenorhabditis bovis]|uniref:Headcase N-terminal domain-containing protein n=1 Tax=Caenorhabditis bovis TaxID=2654633 RepID=A0A8S1E725_9PELO|nr:unnamed protein product [Caenorhabditis bovis]
MKGRIDKTRKANKAARAAGSVSEEAIEWAGPGCPVPGMNCCNSRVPVDEEDEVYLTCTNDTCPIIKHPLHRQCYAELEESLVKKLGTLGSARGWTESQRLHNLWEKKGISLIGKICRCRCGLGHYSLDKQKLYEQEKAKEKKQKKTKRQTKTTLPTLNSGGRAPPAEQKKKKKNQNVSDLSFSSSACTPDNSFVQKSCSKDLSNTSVFSDIVVLAPTPPQQSLSYAATIRNCKKKNDSGFETPRSSTDCSREHVNEELDKSESKPEISESSVQDAEKEAHEEFAEEVALLSPIHHTPAPTPTEWSAIAKKAMTPAMVIGQQSAFPFTSTPKANNSRSMIRKLSPGPSSRNSQSAARMFFNTHFDVDKETNRSTIVIAKPTHEPVLRRAERSNPASSTSPDAEVEPIAEECFGWTPFHGQDFNLGEKLHYLP